MEKRHASASIPKKPLAVSKTKKNLPMELDWGEGIPKDRLRYINADEEALIKRFRTSRSARDYAGIPAYADDSASSKGVERGPSPSRGADGPSGVGRGAGGGGPSRAGQGPNSPSSSSAGSKSPSSTSSSTGGGSKAQSAASVGPSRAPNAAAQAASNAYRSPQTNASVSPGTGKAPNMAASYASQKLNATSNALRSAQQPQSIQGMINSGVSNPVSLSGRYDDGVYHSGFSRGTNTLPGQNAPNQFDRTIRPTNMVNAAHVPMDTWSKAYDANALTPGAQKIHQAITDNAFRTNTPVDFFSGASPRASGTLQHPMGQAIDVRLRDPLTGDFVGADKIGSLAANPIGNYKPLMGRTERVANAIQGAIEKPYRNFATGVINSFMDNPGVYGDFNNQRWGGAFNGPWGKDYMHYDEGKVTSAVNADQAALRKEAANYKAPTSSAGTMLAGGPPSANDERVLSVENYVDTAGIRDPAAARMASVQQPPTAPTRSPTMALSNPFGAYNPVASGRMASLQTRLGVDDALSAGSVQTASNDAPTPVFSDNPVQGSQNPMQDEGENPQVKRDRQIKYANRGATIGGVIAGPIGTVVGATLGWQMGKTSPQQRQAIASNPQALQANVQSINEMVDQRGGKGNPNLKVTEVGLKDVLENPQKVTANPQAYTSLEQSLASLAQGIDPETGQAI